MILDGVDHHLFDIHLIYEAQHDILIVPSNAKIVEDAGENIGDY
jgi:hypothetical protein